MERDLPQSQTGGLKLMTVFIVVLALHVFVIGAISGYHIYRGDDKDANDQLAANAKEKSTETRDGGVSEPMGGSGDLSATPGSTALSYSSQPAPLTVEQPAAPAPSLPPVSDNYPPASAPGIDPAHPAPPRAKALPPEQQDVPPGMGTYTVKSGDTLKKIATRFNMSVADIMEINNMPQDHIRVGDKLKLTGARVASGTDTTKADSTGKPKKDDKKTTATAKTEKPERKYKVESGDTVAYIAKKYKTTIAAVRSANGLDDTVTKPKVGTVLKIPGGTTSTKDVAKNNQ